MKMKMRYLAIALMMCFTSSSALAYTITGAGDSFSVVFGGNVDETDVPGLTAEATFTVESFDLREIVLDITLANTADASIWQSARVSAIGFNTNPLLDGATILSGIFSEAVTGDNEKFPNQYGYVDLCLINNQNNCGGGASGGLAIGETGASRVKLFFDQDITSLEITNIGVRYQSLESEQLGISDGSGTGGETPIPEPSAALVFGLGVLVVGTRARKH